VSVSFTEKNLVPTAAGCRLPVAALAHRIGPASGSDETLLLASGAASAARTRSPWSSRWFRVATASMTPGCRGWAPLGRCSTAGIPVAAVW